MVVSQGGNAFRVPFLAVDLGKSYTKNGTQFKYIVHKL